MKKVHSNSLKFWAILLITLIVALTYCLISCLNSKYGIKTNYDTQTIQIQAFDYTTITDKFDEISILPSEEENVKIVNTLFKLSGTSLNDVVFTSNVDEQNVLVTGTTVVDEETEEGVINLTLDYGECTDEVEAFTNVRYVDGEFQGTIIFDGVEYEVNDVINATYGQDGVQECWFWLIIKIVVVIVNVAVAVATAVDIFKYLLSEEVTLDGVLCIVAEGLVMAATSAIGGAVAGSLIKSGAKVVKSAKKVKGNTQYLLGRSAKTLINERTNLVKSGKRSVNHSYNYKSGDKSIREAYAKKKEFKGYNFTDSSRNDYVEIHHIVEQSQAGKKFNYGEIHTDLNTFGIPKEMHREISGIYSSSTKNLGTIQNIFGNNFFDGSTTFRKFVQSKNFNEQYEIGLKLIEYFVGKKGASGQKYFILSL